MREAEEDPASDNELEDDLEEEADEGDFEEPVTGFEEDHIPRDDSNQDGMEVNFDGPLGDLHLPVNVRNDLVLDLKRRKARGQRGRHSTH